MSWMSRAVAECVWLLVAAVVALLAGGRPSADSTVVRDAFAAGMLTGWHPRSGMWDVQHGRAEARGGGLSILLLDRQQPHDFEAAADVSSFATDAGAAAGLAFRFQEDGTGYLAGLRDVEKGVSSQFGPWERPVLQLYRLDRDGWKLLQESKVTGGSADLPRQVKVVCRGPNIWVFYGDLKRPVLTEYDDRYDRPSAVGLWKDNLGVAAFDNFYLSPPSLTPPPPLRTDWSWVRGAVYVRSNAVNSVQMWEDYWPHTALLDRELSYAADYGFNMIQVYLHWIVWDRHRTEYLKRIEDLLARASHYHLKVNLILWDDCGSVEPSLTFADPVPGRHNSQMMPNPSHRIRDSAAELDAHRERFRDYVQGVTTRFKDDPRLSFWQLYNEGMGARETYRTSQTDGNINRLLRWTHDWVKATGTKVPVTATGGGFFGSQFSDFYSYHSYRMGDGPLPNADGGPEHLCTETLDRPYADLNACLHGLAGKQNGLVVWELMIGRDNCRFPWGHPDGLDEPTVPFHGVVYPDGHPWSLAEIQALLGEERFAALKRRMFRVEYFNGNFGSSRKVSITPRIDFDLRSERGYGSPDASAGVYSDRFSIRWTGNLTVGRNGTYEWSGSGDGALRVWIDGHPVIDRPATGTADGRLRLVAGRTYPVKVEYVHAGGTPQVHLLWSGERLARQVFLLPDP